MVLKSHTTCRLTELGHHRKYNSFSIVSNDIVTVGTLLFDKLMQYEMANISLSFYLRVLTFNRHRFYFSLTIFSNLIVE